MKLTLNDVKVRTVEMMEQFNIQYSETLKHLKCQLITDMLPKYCASQDNSYYSYYILTNDLYTTPEHTQIRIATCKKTL